jgi:molecular chaperone DnaK
VITVPAYFDEVRRKATQDAGYMAGLDVLDIINEPTAAAIAHGYQKGFLKRDGSAAAPQKLLVYDLGGGTFDVTVMEVRGHEFVALATDGDTHLGGWDWDRKLVDLVAEEFLRQHGLDPRSEPNAEGRLWRDCEDAKRTLSARAKATIGFDFRGQAIRLDATREQFEELTAELLDRTRLTTRLTLQAAGLLWKDIDHVLLVGGSTRMPMVARMLEQLTGKKPDGSVAVDEAVAHGAAIHAGNLLAKLSGKRPPLAVRNVNSHSLGVVGTDPATLRRRTAVIVPRNTRLPISATRVFRTQRAGQPTILVQIVEGESASPDDCTPIGKFTVRNLPANLPAETPVTIRFVYHENGRLAIHLSVGGGECEVTQEIVRDNGLARQQLDAWRQFITGESGGEPADDESQGPEPSEHSAAQGPWT